MSANPVRRVSVPASADRLVKQVLSTFGWLQYQRDGKRLLLEDGERRVNVDINDESKPTDDEFGTCHCVDAVKFEFVGYSESEADELVRQYLWSTVLNSDGEACRTFGEWSEPDEDRPSVARTS